MFQCANQYMATEAPMMGKRKDHKRPHIEKSRGQPSETIRRHLDQPKLSYLRPPSPPLTSTRTYIFLQIMEKGLLSMPNLLKGPRELRDWAKYYRFHQDYSHDTEDCHDLCNQIEELIRRGEAEYPNHDDALVILVYVIDTLVKRVMVDTGSSADVLNQNAFQKIGLIAIDLLPMSSTLTWFTRDSIAPLGTTVLPVTLGQEPESKTLMVTLMVLGFRTAYNIILG
ncbi:hypothetical protein B296_00007236 [Ensete ventricosum]|uniref:Uncharacterized protein n=1 Tax=Ensete ventricosum TaxID=4639 RepID=A0A427AX22_ENSVE|nr:hypothetical protein B296_00007236 [Ensete ventricosum]